MLDWQASLSILAKPGIFVYIMRGVLFTLVISVCAVVVSIFIGSVLGLMRDYCNGPTRVLKWLATAYIELFRNTPPSLLDLHLSGLLSGAGILHPPDAGSHQRGSPGPLPGLCGSGPL